MILKKGKETYKGWKKRKHKDYISDFSFSFFLFLFFLYIIKHKCNRGYTFRSCMNYESFRLVCVGCGQNFSVKL